MADESIIAPVISQPSLPIKLTTSGKRAFGVSPQEMNLAKARADQGMPILALRFSEDSKSPPDKFETLRQEFGGTPEWVENSPELCWQRGKTLKTIEINSKPGNPFEILSSSHAVLTLEYRGNGHPTNKVFQRVIEFMQEQFSRRAIGAHSKDKP
jgi:hypothetical protein